MRLTWVGEADVTKIGIKLDDEGQRIVTVTLVALLDADKVGRLFGPDLRRLVFDSRVEATTVRCDQWKPRAVFEAHWLTLADNKPVACLPEFDRIEPAGAGHVRVFLKIPFALDDRKLTVAVVEAFGGPISVSVTPAQGALPVG